MFKICDSKAAAKTPTTLQLSDAPASQSHKCPKFRSHVDSPPPEHESCSAYLTLAKCTEFLKRTSLNHIWTFTNFKRGLWVQEINVGPWNCFVRLHETWGCSNPEWEARICLTECMSCMSPDRCAPIAVPGRNLEVQNNTSHESSRVKSPMPFSQQNRGSNN